MSKRGTIAVEEAIITPSTKWLLEETFSILNPGDSSNKALEAHAAKLLDIHDKRLATMDAEGVEYMLLSLTAPGCQGITNPQLAEQTAKEANDWLACEVAKRPERFGGLAALSMHNPEEAAQELERAVKQLGFFGGLVNDYQSLEGGSGRECFDTAKYDPFWKKVEELDVPIYLHPRYVSIKDLQPGSLYGDRPHLQGAAVQFHLDLSYHIYALCSSGVFDRFPGAKIVAGHLGENIPLNLWRASHWYNKPSKKATRPSKEDYSYYFKHNVYITTSGNFFTPGLKLCIETIGLERCMYSIVNYQSDWVPLHPEIVHTQYSLIMAIITNAPLSHQAAVYDRPGELSTKVVDIETPSPSAGEVLVKLSHSGVCHSDLSIMTNSWGMPFSLPDTQIGGHEGVGTVVQIGDGADLHGFAIGDRVGVKWLRDICGSCVYCIAGEDGLCAKQSVSGMFNPGTFQQYLTVPARYLTPIPDGVSSEVAAPMLCAGLTSYAALRKVTASPGDWVAVSGAGGGLGHLVTQIAARAFGYRVIGIDQASKEDVVKESGAEIFIDAATPSEELVSKVKKLADNLGANAVVVCASSNAAYSQGLELLRPGGTLVGVGMPGDEEAGGVDGGV
ncbi:2 3-dihydroxybenzoate decarboxylase [Fusarium subglutinans]|uniref:2 3-dihydroxybenzoate decarboxylase n=1 Tax=Gibberella subglutinans TaxID=42677 RepID=A0A8H5UNL0_GIBSU|nr:2 3-dihydroxybenzoate decarboxylase [Fusarium subglutinans]KAF5594016.1 2 3-dihydroxybenzoate decarboxylase [Fusarium subglutinans]